MALFSRRATIDWNGDVLHGDGRVAAGSQSFYVPVTYPHIAGEPAGMTTPEELLAASHATCFGIGLRSLIKQRGGTARRVRVRATVTAEKGANGIRIQSSHLHAEVEGLAGIDADALPDVARAAEAGCTISAAIRAAVAITVDVSDVHYP